MCGGEFDSLVNQQHLQDVSPGLFPADIGAFLPSPPTISRRSSIAAHQIADGGSSGSSSPFLAATRVADSSEVSSVDLHAEAAREPQPLVVQFHEEWVNTVRFTSKTRRTVATESAATTQDVVPKPSFLRRAPAAPSAPSSPASPSHKATRENRFWYEPYKAVVF